MLIPILITIVGLAWLGYETDWQYRIILRAISESGVKATPPSYVFRTEVAKPILALLPSKELTQILTDASDDAEALQLAQWAYKDIGFELAGRASPYGSGFCVTHRFKGIKAQRPYRGVDAKELYTDYQALDWYVGALTEAMA